MTAISATLTYGPYYPPTSCTWNPSNKSTNVTLTDSNLTATFGVNGTCLATSGVSAGKYYWEVHTNAVGDGGNAIAYNVGIANATVSKVVSSTTTFPDTANAYGYDGLYRIKTDSLGHSETADGDYPIKGQGILRFMLDMDAKTLDIEARFTNNFAEPVIKTTKFTGIVADTYYPAAGYPDSNSGNYVVRGKFNPSSWAFSPPFGYTTLP